MALILTFIINGGATLVPEKMEHFTKYFGGGVVAAVMGQAELSLRIEVPRSKVVSSQH